MNIRYRVELSEAERDELAGLLSGGRQAARKLKRAQILLAADGGASDAAIASCIGVGESTVYRTNLTKSDFSRARRGGMIARTAAVGEALQEARS
jgi:hypothetical protein